MTDLYPKLFEAVIRPEIPFPFCGFYFYLDESEGATIQARKNSFLKVGRDLSDRCFVCCQPLMQPSKLDMYLVCSHRIRVGPSSEVWRE